MLTVADWGEKGTHDKKYPLTSACLRWILLPCIEDSLFIPTDSNQVLSFFEKPNKSIGAGPGGISSQLIIDCTDLIAPHIISITFNSGAPHAAQPHN